MSSVAIFLTAASFALTPPADLKRSPAPQPPTSSAVTRVAGACAPQLDPQFVHFVPAAPAQADDGLFRLISNPEHRVSQTNAGDRHLGRLAGCEQMLLTGYVPRR